MITVDDWGSVKQWTLIEDGLCGYHVYFEDGECDRFCAIIDCYGYARIWMVNEKNYGYVMLSPEILTELAKMTKRVRKIFEDKWNDH